MSSPETFADALDLLALGETMVLVTPAPGQGVVLGGGATLTAGGAESNVAVGAAARGVRAGWFSRVGEGPLGRVVLDSVRGSGVEVSRVKIDPTRPTGLMVKQPDPAGSRVFYYRAGSAASAMSPADIPSLPSARVIHLSGITSALSTSCRQLLREIVGGGFPATVSFDVNYRPALWGTRDEAARELLDVARQSDIVFVGRDEAENLWGTSTAEGVRELMPDVGHLVVKDGSLEAVEFGGGATERVPAHAVEVVEPVGAGDAFAAGWLSTWLTDSDGDAAQRLRAGHAAAAAVLRSPTDQAAPARHQAGT